MSQLLDRVLAAARQLGASDVHLKAGLPPIFRITGELRTLREMPAVPPEALAQLAERMMNDRQRASFEQDRDLDLAVGPPSAGGSTGAGGSTSDEGRYRVHLFQRGGSVGMVLRLIPPEVPPFDRLNLPQTVLELTAHPQGLVLVTGAAGSGRSTTLAAMIDHVNAHRACHILTVEDPIEHAFADKRSVVSQRELGRDTTSFPRALRAALRQDPDVILVGELRDRETAELALTAAATGRLVLGALLAAGAAEAVGELVALFPATEQARARRALAAVLRGVVAQRLLPRADGKGMIPATELLVCTEQIRALLGEPLEDPARAAELRAAIDQGQAAHGMMTLDQSLASLVRRRLVTYDAALALASRPSDFALLFRGASAAPHPSWARGLAAVDANPGAGHDRYEHEIEGK